MDAVNMNGTVIATMSANDASFVSAVLARALRENPPHSADAREIVRRAQWTLYAASSEGDKRQYRKDCPTCGATIGEPCKPEYGCSYHDRH